MAIPIVYNLVVLNGLLKERDCPSFNGAGFSHLRRQSLFLSMSLAG